MPGFGSREYLFLVASVFFRMGTLALYHLHSLHVQCGGRFSDCTGVLWFLVAFFGYWGRFSRGASLRFSVLGRMMLQCGWVGARMGVRFSLSPLHFVCVGSRD
jgi:hypothetical protein